MLGPARITKPLAMTEDDRALLEVILQMRLSDAAVYSVSSGTSTQKNEAFNRAASATMSKSVSYSRTFKGRLAAQILQSNNPIHEAVTKKMVALSGISPCLRARDRLKRLSNMSANSKRYKKTIAYKRKRRNVRARFEQEHRAKKESSGNREPEYVKGLLDDDMHSYAIKQN